MQKIKVNVVVADRKFRKLLFSVKPKEKEAIVEKKRSLMVRQGYGKSNSLSVGHISSLN